MALGLTFSRLENLRSDENYCFKVISAWLRAEDNVCIRSGEPSWESLAWALGDIGQTGIRNRILDARAVLIPS